MSRTVFCRKYKQNLEGLDHPPFPGPEGEDIFNSVSKSAWQAWLKHQTLLINEKHLRLFELQAQAYLKEQRGKFLNNEAVDHAEGYVPSQN